VDQPRGPNHRGINLARADVEAIVAIPQHDPLASRLVTVMTANRLAHSRVNTRDIDAALTQLADDQFSVVSSAALMM
jgi:hypothetical protein